MALKTHYKKIFVIAAALVVLFAPVGVTRTRLAFAQTIDTQSPTINTTIPQQQTQNLNLAPTATSPSTQGASVGKTQTSNLNLYSCATNVGTCGIFLVALAVNGVMGVLLSGGAWLVKLALQFNSNIFSAPGVQTGFSILLAVANLFFVLGIIIIAIATIIRNQTYGIKQLLWKLVLMAILVNFGLVITAPIVGFADNMSNYFISATVSSGANGAYGAYVSGLMSAFNPQTPAEAPAAANNNAQVQLCADSLASGDTLYSLAPNADPCKGLSQANGEAAFSIAQQELSTSDKFWQQTMGLVLDIALSGIAAFTFICLAILLLIRYLMLGGLLIVLPLAWATYVFPKFDNSYSKWWNNFIKWTFFPPLALFFIYIAFTTAAITQTTNKTSSAVSYTATAVIGTGNNTDNSAIASLSTQTGLPSNLFVQAGDEVLLVGLMIMGLMFALSLSGKAGSTVVNGATAVTKATAGYVGKKTGKGAARLYQKAGGENLSAAMQRNRILAPLGRGVSKLTESATKDQVEARAKALGLSGMDDDKLKNVTQGLRGHEDEMAAVEEWQKRGKLDKIEKIGGVSFTEWLKKNQQPLKDYRKGKLSGDIDNAMMSNDKIRRIAEVTAGARQAVGEDNIKAAEDSATVIDKNGITGPANIGKTILAKDLAKAAESHPAREAAQEVLDDENSTKAQKKIAKAQIAKIDDAAADASAAMAEAVNKKVDAVEVVDKENLLGRGAGQKVQAGEFRKLMETESEKFWEGKDKGAAAKMRPDAIFGGKEKFGLTKETLDEIGRSVAHGIITQSPGAMGSLAGKTDNLKQLNKLTDAYLKGIREARKNNKISDEQAKKMEEATRKMLGAKLAFMGGGGDAPAPAPAPKP